MKQLSKLESVIFLLGGVLMVAVRLASHLVFHIRSWCR
mgnify:CR=1 FL=1